MSALSSRSRAQRAQAQNPPQQRRKLSQGIVNQYDAGGSGRRMRGWNPPNSGPNRAIVGAEKIRARAHDAIRNDWSGESSVQKWTTTLVGCGIVPRWENEDYGKLWARWGRVADSAGVLDVYGLQALGVRSLIGSGEVFLRRRPRSLRRGLPVPLQVQIIESDYCPIFDADEREGMPEGNRIRQGIELNKFDDRVAYWMFKEHPGESYIGRTPAADQLIRVPASDVIHMFELKRAGQLRGVSGLAPVLARLRATGDFEDAVLDRQKLANLFTLFITKTLPESWEDLELDGSGLPKFYNSEGTPIVGLEPGISQELNPGEDVKFANPPEAGVGYGEYLRSTQLGTAAGQGLPYELYSGDIANVSDRTLRVVINEFRRYAEQRQWHTIIPQMCQRIVEWFADAAVLSGELPLSALEELKSPEHVPHGWAYIHPVQDVQGKVLAINAGLTSRDREISAAGLDPRKIDAERKAAKEREDSLGLAPPEPTDPTGQPGQPSKPGQGQKKPVPKAELAPEVTQMLETMQTMAASMQSMFASMSQALVAASAPQPQASAAVAPVINNYLQPPVVNVASPDVRIEPPVVNVAPPTVNVTNEVPAPIVTVEPPVVNVAPPAVHITNEMPVPEVTVNLPDRQTESVITRNHMGDIERVVQVEKTLQ